MPDYLRSRLSFLKDLQNRDGGWGYFPGKASWLEPTVWSMIALQADSAAGPSLERAHALLRSWQLPTGAWRPCATVQEAHWSTALTVILHAVGRTDKHGCERAVGWLLGTQGAEGRLVGRILYFLSPRTVEQNPNLRGWPWFPGTNSWVEPTALTALALKLTRRQSRDSRLRSRIRMAEQMLLDRRCPDAGWNYGNRRVLGEDLPGYPETTAVSLMGLQGVTYDKLKLSLNQALRWWEDPASRLARAWLTICLKSYGLLDPEAKPSDMPPSPDITVSALEALGAAGGSWSLLRAGEWLS